MDTKPGPQYKIVATYVIVGTLWIYFTDLIISTHFHTFANTAQNLKGCGFIMVTGTLLFFLIKRDFNALQRANQEIVRSYEQTIRGWVRIMDMRHKETMHHTERVTRMTVELAKLSGIHDDEELRCIEQGAILHDIGKIGIPDSILIKPGKLNEAEWALMKKHPVIAHDILSRINYLGASVDIPYCHHERWDGSGYPRGLKGEAIPISARIFAVIDVWDALIHERVYKAAWSRDEARTYLQEQAGKHFDPRIVKIFLDNEDRICDQVRDIDLISPSPLYENWVSPDC